MAIAFRSATTAQGNAASLTVNVPVGTANGDLLLLFGSNSGPFSYTTPSGWTPLESPLVVSWAQSALFYRIASSEPASYSLAISAGYWSTATMLCYTGAGGVRSHSNTVTSSAGTTGTPAAPSGVIATDMVVHCYGIGAEPASTTDIAITPPGGAWNTRATISAAQGGSNTYGSATAAIDQIGSSATPSATSNNPGQWPIASVALMLAAAAQNITPTGIASGEAFGTPTVSVGVPTPASGPLRRFDPIEKVVKDTRSQALDAASTALARLGTHTHAESSITGLVTDLAGKSLVGHTHPPTDITSATLHEARYEQHTLQGVANATDSKLTFDTAITTCADVTASGTGNTDFLLNRAGLWRVSAGACFVSNTTGGRHLFLTTGTVLATFANRVVGASAPGASIDNVLSVSTDIRVAAGTSVCAGVYQSSGGSLNTDVGFGGYIHIALTWLRP